MKIWKNQLQLAQNNDSDWHASLDGFFAMDGNVAPLNRSWRWQINTTPWWMGDESHSAGVVVKRERCTELYNHVRWIITGTLAKHSLEHCGFTTGKKEIIELLRQRSRPYLSPIPYLRSWLQQDQDGRNDDRTNELQISFTGIPNISSAGWQP